MRKRGAIFLVRPKTKLTLPQISHCSEYEKANSCMFDVTCFIPTPTDVIATTRGKCPYSQREYTPTLPFSRTARVAAPSTLSKYSHHKLKGILRPKTSIDIE